MRPQRDERFVGPSDDSLGLPTRKRLAVASALHTPFDGWFALLSRSCGSDEAGRESRDRYSSTEDVRGDVGLRGDGAGAAI